MLHREAWSVATPADLLRAPAPSSESPRPGDLALWAGPAGTRAQQPGVGKQSRRAATAPRSQASQNTQSAVARFLPSPGPLQFVDSAYDQVLLDPAEPIDEDRPVQVIHLVLKRACKELAAFDRLFRASSIQAPHNGTRWTDDRRIEAGHAEAAFLFELHAVTLDEDRVDHDDQI